MTKPRIVPAGEFKAKCLKLMDEIHEQGGELIITKRGKPVAKLVPPDEPKQPRDIFGCMKGTIKIVGDIVGPFHEEWAVTTDEPDS